MVAAFLQLNDSEEARKENSQEKDGGNCEFDSTTGPWKECG